MRWEEQCSHQVALDASRQGLAVLGPTILVEIVILQVHLLAGGLKLRLGLALLAPLQGVGDAITSSGRGAGG